MDQPLSQREKILNIIKETALSTTSHGLPKILSSPYLILKIMWTLFLCISAGLCIYMNLNNVFNYFNFDVITTIREINEFPSVFPTVTICNVNRFTTDYAHEYLRQLGKKSNLPDIFDRRVYANLSLEQKDLLIFQYLIMGYGNIYTLNQTQQRKLNYELDDVLLSCTFALSDCNSNDFVIIDHPLYGNCYSFNSGMNSSGDKVPFKQVYTGYNFESLGIQIFMGVPDNLGIIRSNTGLAVFVHNSSTSPLSLNPMSFAGDGTEIQMSVTRTFTNRLPSPYSQCNLDADQSQQIKSDLYQLIISIGYEYTQIYCISQCFQKFLIKKCGCVNFFFPTLFQVKTCSSIEEFQCMGEFYYQFQMNNFMEDNCFPLCPLECNSKRYATSTSTLRYPQYFEFEKLNQSAIVKNLYYSKEYSTSLINNIVSLNIYLEKLSYTMIDEATALDFVTLLSNLGGTAGLFLGISVLSLVEIFDALIVIIIELCRKNYVENKKSKRIQPIKLFEPFKKPNN